MKRLVILLAVILVVPVAAQGTFVIVSNSDCDVAMAELLASVMEAKIVKVEWGEFDEEALTEVVEEDPETIIIIGGNMAVVEQVQEFLENLGFPILRIAGRDRAETSLELYKNFKDYFNDDFAVIVVDMNKASILRGKKQAMKSGVPLFFCDVSQLDDMIEEISELGIEDVKIVTGNRQSDLRTTCEKRLKETEERLKETEERLKETEEEAEVEETDIEEAEVEETEVEETEVEETEVEEEAKTEEEKMLEECKTLLQKARDAFEDGNYILCLQYLTDIETLLNNLEEEL
jgi:putative cell wall-binding protein